MTTGCPQLTTGHTLVKRYWNKMSCVKMNIKDLLKKWIEQNMNIKENKDYVYMNWHFQKSNSKQEKDHMNLNINSIEELPRLSEFENIQKWLELQDNLTSCEEIYCDLLYF